MLVYKIHPAIGVARVGDHPSAFFIGPETPEKQGIEIDRSGVETPLNKYKEAGQIKRQAARFRIFEYNVDSEGTQTLIREITAADAEIEWKVDLVNRKAALNRTPRSSVDPHSAGRARNQHLSGAARDALVIQDPRVRTVRGTNIGASAAHPPVAFDGGSFLGKAVYLGELRTDPSGRLLVLGGHGKSESVPPGQPVGEFPGDFANNDFWHDDVADGPVTATVSFSGQAPQAVQFPAWVTVAPPDFAPGIEGIVTLYDVAFQSAIDRGFKAPDAKPSFRRHILPVIQRAANLRFVNNFTVWDALPRNFSVLSDTSAASATIRKSVVDFLMPPRISAKLNDAVIPKYMQTYFAQYQSGDFINDLASALPVTTIPEDLDCSALEACVGHSFFPGIETSFNLRDGNIYSETFRINHTASGVSAGFLTEIMAVPWQADFLKCQTDRRAWWPSQRPDIVMRDQANIPGSQSEWLQGVSSHQDMVDKFATLSFVVPETVGEDTVFVEEK
jgi:hypothetical protein